MEDKLKILQHNVQHWKTRKDNLKEYYYEIKPDIILINSHGLKDEEPLTLRGYKQSR